MSAECKTCGTNNPKVRGMLSAYDCDIDFAGPASNRVSSQETSTGNGKWYCGLCPDTWHDYERRCGKERRSTTPTTQPAPYGHCPRCRGKLDKGLNGLYCTCGYPEQARTTQSREAELAKALSFLRRFVACETNYDDLHVEAEQWLDDLDASKTPAPVGDESPSLANARVKLIENLVEAVRNQSHWNGFDQTELGKAFRALYK